MNRKKWMSFLMAAALALTTVFGTSSVTMAEETTEAAKGMITVYVAAEGTDTDGNTVNVGITPVRVEAGTTADKAVAKALEASGYDETQYSIEDSGYGANLSKIGDVANASDWSYYWSLYLNGGYAQDSLGNIILQENDEISYVYVSKSDYVTTGAAVYVDDVSLNPDSETAAALLTSAKEQQQILAKTIYDTVFGDGQTTYGLENVDAFYVAFSLMRAGYFPEGNCYGAMYQKLAAQLKELKESGNVTVDGVQKSEADILGKYPELTYAKAVLFVSALGGDAKNVGGVDLIEKMAQKSVYEASAGSYTNDCTILLAWDSANYELPTGDNYITRAQVIDSITGQMDSTLEMSAMYNSPDMIAMLLQPLHRYTQMTAQEKADLGFDDAALTQTCTQGIRYLENTQGAAGSWDNAYGSNNAWTLAQIMTTMGQFQINACSEEDGSDFIKNGKTVLDDAAAFVDTKNGTVDENLMTYQPEQLLRGLNAVIRVMDGQNTLYDTTDAQNNVPDLTPAVTPAPSQTPAATQIPAPSQTPTASAVTEGQDENGAVVSSVKKVKAAKTTVTVKKGKKATLKWNITLKKKNAALGKTTVKYNRTYVKVIKKKATKKSAKVREVTVQIKGLKKGSSNVTLRVGGKSAAVKVRVK